MEQPFIMRIDWHGGTAVEGPLPVDAAVQMLEASPTGLPVPYTPEMRQSRDAIRLLIGGVFGKALEKSPDHAWLLSTPEGSSWAIPGRAVLAVEVADPSSPSGGPNPIGFVPPTRIRA